MQLYVVETLEGAEMDCWVVDSIWDSHAKAEEYAKRVFQQARWGSPVPDWQITVYNLNEARYGG